MPSALKPKDLRNALSDTKSHVKAALEIATDFRNDEIILFCAEMLENKSKIKVSKAWIHAERRNYFCCKAGLHIQALAELRSGLLQKQQGRKLLKQLLG